MANIGPFVQPKQQKKGMSGSWSAFANSWVMVGETIILIFCYGLPPVIINQLVVGTKFLDCANDHIHHRFFYVAPLKALILHILGTKGLWGHEY